MLTVVTGCMFAGKTESLQEFMLERVSLNKRGIIFTSDSRHEGAVVSHSGKVLDNSNIDTVYIDPCRVATETLILQCAPYSVIGFDEINFLYSGILICFWNAMKDSKDICMVGLNMDYKEYPFDSTMQMLSRADNIIFKHAYCEKCNGKASLTIRKHCVADRIVEGGKELYYPMCRGCKE